MAPMFALTSRVRRARTFHPRGLTFLATVAESPDVPRELSSLATRLAGSALVRFSGALWKSAEGVPDVLGCAVRLQREQREKAIPADDDQDLLFATIRRPWTMPLAPFSTNVHDYLANDYFAVSPFDAGLARPVYLRLHPEGRSADGEGSRLDRLTREVERGGARLRLDVSDRPFGPWTPVVTLVLERLARVDDEALRFLPFRAGRGVQPRGLVHAMRIGVYRLSQRARPMSRRRLLAYSRSECMPRMHEA